MKEKVTKLSIIVQILTCLFLDNLKVEDLVPVLPQLSDYRVHFNEENKLVWPVVFMYPEYKIMDFIQEFVEDERFIHHLCHIFESPPSWDTENKYSFASVNVYFQDHDTNKIHLVDKTETLMDTLKRPEYVEVG